MQRDQSTLSYFTSDNIASSSDCINLPFLVKETVKTIM